MNYKILPGKIQISISKFDEIAGELGNLQKELEEAGQNNRTGMTSYQNIQNVLAEVQTEVRYRTTEMTSLKSALAEICQAYRNTENEVIGDLSGKKVSIWSGLLLDIEKVRDISESSGNFLGNIDGKKLFENFLNSADGVRKIEKLVAFYDKFKNEQMESVTVEEITGLIGFMKSISDVYSEKNDTPSKVYSDYLKMLYKGLKFDKSTVQLLEKYVYKNDTGLKNKFMEDYVPFLHGLNIVQKFTDDLSESDGLNTKFFKNSNEIVSAISEIYKDKQIKDLNLSGIAKFREQYNTSVNTTGPIESLINMAVYSVSDGIEKFHDGVTWDEVGKWLEGTGVTGANTMISNLTGGTVNLKTEKVLDNFSEAEAFTTELIDGLDAPLEVKVGWGLAASIPVALWSMGKSLFDFGWDIGEKINSVFA